MRRLLLGTILCACTAVVADNVASTNGVRNPFWPMGYEGVRETISPNVRPKPKPDPTKAAEVELVVRAYVNQRRQMAVCCLLHTKGDDISADYASPPKGK